jgi:L-ribulose-5-phosphate 3-epimerase
MNLPIQRRKVIGGLLGMAAVPKQVSLASSNEKEKLPLCVFSKHFQWAGIQEMAESAAALGFDGIDLTVRKGGHILPERVQDDLPKAVEIIRKSGLQVPMITSEIVDTQSAYADKILKTLSALGIRRYRWGGFRYQEDRSLPEQLAILKERVKELAAWNTQYGVVAMYHTHSGIGQVGASMWDLYLLLKDFSSDSVAVNFDIGHAFVEGGYGGWIHSTRLLLPYMKGTAIKDFRWKQNSSGMWVPGWCPLGKGMVNLTKYLSMLKEGHFSGPIQMHFEYPEMGGADTGKTQLSVPKEQVLALMRNDLQLLREMLQKTPTH